MKPDDQRIRWIEEPKLGGSGKMYLPLFLQGLTTTLRHLVGPKLTVHSPEQRHEIPLLGEKGLRHRSFPELAQVRHRPLPRAHSSFPRSIDPTPTAAGAGMIRVIPSPEPV